MIDPPMMLPMVQIAYDKIPPGHFRKIGGRFSYAPPERVRRPGLDEQAHWDEVDVRDGMLEAGCHEGRNWRNDRDNPVDVGARAETHPHRQAHQRIAHDPEGQCGDKGQRSFRICRAEGRESDCAPPNVYCVV